MTRDEEMKSNGVGSILGAESSSNSYLSDFDKRMYGNKLRTGSRDGG